MGYKMNDTKWESVMGLIRESIKNPDKIPDDVLLLSLEKEEITEIFTPKRLEILNMIKKESPETMSGLANKVKRELPSVERDLKILESYGIVSLEKMGREVKPVIGKEIIVLPLSQPLTLEKIKQ